MQTDNCFVYCTIIFWGQALLSENTRHLTTHSIGPFHSIDWFRYGENISCCWITYKFRFISRFFVVILNNRFFSEKDIGYTRKMKRSLSVVEKDLGLTAYSLSVVLLALFIDFSSSINVWFVLGCCCHYNFT